jgi:transposase-like protein
MTGELSTPRVQPFYCPYCGEEDFVPAGPLDSGDSGHSGGGHFHCRSCDRRFVVRFLGLGPGPEPGPGQEAAAWVSGTP